MDNKNLATDIDIFTGEPGFIDIFTGEPGFNGATLVTDIPKYNFTEKSCIVVEMITKKESDDTIMVLWTEFFDTDEFESVIAFLRKALKIPDLEFIKQEFGQEIMYSSKDTFYLKNLENFNIEENDYIKAVDNKQTEPWIKIMVRTGSFMRDNTRFQ